jgi:hypothetical protein
VAPESDLTLRMMSNDLNIDKKMILSILREDLRKRNLRKRISQTHSRMSIKNGDSHYAKT